MTGGGDSERKRIGAPGAAGRRARVAAAQTRRRDRMQDGGFVLVQGFVPKLRRPRFRELKAEFGVASMGGVLLRLLDEWEAGNGIKRIKKG
jgi:hypothetical protein